MTTEQPTNEGGGTPALRLAGSGSSGASHIPASRGSFYAHGTLFQVIDWETSRIIGRVWLDVSLWSTDRLHAINWNRMQEQWMLMRVCHV
jgi:hypothetical protein